METNMNLYFDFMITRNKFQNVSRFCKFVPAEEVVRHYRTPVLALTLESSWNYPPPVSFFRVTAGQKEPLISWVCVCVF